MRLLLVANRYLALVILIFGCDSSVSPVRQLVPSVLITERCSACHRIRASSSLINEPEIGDRRNPQPTSIVVYFLRSRTPSRR